MAFDRPKDGWKFDFGGLKTNAPADQIPPSNYPYLQNIRHVASLQTRPGYTQLFSLSTLAITTSCPLDGAVISVPYSTFLTASGGTAPYTWSIVAGSLPAGLTLNASTGHISGTPTVQGTSTITIKVTDAIGTTRTTPCSLTVAPGLSIDTTCPLPAATTGSPYDLFLAGSGGVAPYTWTIFSGALPTGLSLSTAGEITGTPTLGGDSTFTIRLTDDSGAHVDKSCSMCVNFTASDDFNRANGAIDVGQPEWTKFPSGGMPVIISNQVQLGVSGGAVPFVWWNDASDIPSTQFSQLTFESQPGPAFSTALTGPAVMMGGSDSSPDMYIACYGTYVGQIAPWALILKRRVHSSVATLVEVNVTPSSGDVIKIEAIVGVSDVTLNVYRNGVLTITYVDSSSDRISTGKPGMAQQSAGGATPLWDNWNGGDNC